MATNQTSNTFDSAAAQKSEVHATTADAEGSRTSDGDEASTVHSSHERHAPHGEHYPSSPPSADTHVVRDDTDAGGPLVIESSDPDLNPPRVPIDPFPTDRKPEIDLPVKE